MNVLARVVDQAQHADPHDERVDDAGHPPITIQARSAGELLEAQGRQQRKEDDNPFASGEDGREDDRDHHQPTAVRLPRMADVAAQLSLGQRDSPRREREGRCGDAEVGQENAIVERGPGRHGRSCSRCLAARPARMRLSRTAIV